MLKTEVYDVIIHLAKTGELIIPLDYLISFCENEKDLLAKKAFIAKEANERKKEEGDELAEVVYQAVSYEYASIDEIMERIEGPDVTHSRVASRLNRLVKLGLAEKVQMPCPLPDAPRRKLNHYRLRRPDSTIT